MMRIFVDGIEVYAKLNYFRDKSMGLIGETWEEVKKEYLEEAKADPDIVLTMEELDNMMAH